MKIDFENSIKRYRFLCHPLDIKITWINPCGFYRKIVIYASNIWHNWNFMERITIKKALWSRSMDGYRATTRRQFSFYHKVPRNCWYSYDWLEKDERLSRPWYHPVILNSGSLDWDCSTLTTRPLLSLVYIEIRNKLLFPFTTGPEVRPESPYPF